MQVNCVKLYFGFNVNCICENKNIKLNYDFRRSFLRGIARLSAKTEIALQELFKT
jgi:hypothetical protein